MTAENCSKKPVQIPDSENRNQLQNQLSAVWEQLAEEDRVIMAIELLADMGNEERLIFQEALDSRWPITSDSMPATFALLTITPDDLQQIGLVEDEIKLFDEAKLKELSTEIRNHYVAQGFWEELKYHTTHYLGEAAKNTTSSADNPQNQ